MQPFDLRRKLYAFFKTGDYRKGLSYCREQIQAPQIYQYPAIPELFELGSIWFMMLSGHYEDCRYALEGFGEKSFGTASNRGFFFRLQSDLAYYTENYQEAGKLAKKAVKCYSSIVGTPSRYVLRNQMESEVILARALWKQHRFVKAVELVSALIDRIIKNDPRGVIFGYPLAKATQLLGLILIENRDFATAKNYLSLAQQAIGKKDTGFAPEHPYRAILGIDLVNCQLYSIHSTDSESRASERLKYESKIDFSLKEAYRRLTRLRTEEGERHRYFSHFYRVEGFYLMEVKGDHRSAAASLLKARKIRSNFANKDHKNPGLARIDNYLAKIYANYAPEELENCVERGLEAVRRGEGSLEERPAIIPPRLKLLYTKARFNLGRVENAGVAALEIVYYAIEEATTLIREFIEFIESSGPADDRELIIVQTRPFFELAVWSLHRFQQLESKAAASILNEERLYRMVQKSTNYLLWYKLTEAAARLGNGDHSGSYGPGKFIDLPNFLRECQPALQSYLSDGPETRGSTSLNDNFKRWRDQLPTYHLVAAREANQRFFTPTPIKLAHIQEGISEENTAILDFCISKSKCFATITTRNACRVVSLIEDEAKIRDLRGKIEELLGKLWAQKDFLIENRREAAELRRNVNAYHLLARELYGVLIKPIAALGLLEGITNLYIIPDDFLWLLSFESLVIHTGEGEHHHRPVYLIDHYTVTYNYSVPIIHHNYNEVTTSTGPGSGLDFFQGDSRNDEPQLQDIYDVFREVNEATQYPSGNIDQATAHRYRPVTNARELFDFIEQGKKVTVLVSHGEKDMMLLSPPPNRQTLTVADLLNYPGLFDGIDLLLLFACNENLHTRAGEGFKDLTRAFYSKKVSNVIYNTGRVTTKEVIDLLNYLFKRLELSKGGNTLRFSELLREFKLQEIENGAIPAEWAMLSFLGCMTYSIH